MQHVVLALVAGTPDELQQIVACKDLARVLSQIREQAVFRRRERELAAIDQRAVAAGIQREAADAVRRIERGVAVGAAKDGFHAGDELTRALPLPAPEPDHDGCDERETRPEPAVLRASLRPPGAPIEIQPLPTPRIGSFLTDPAPVVGEGRPKGEGPASEAEVTDPMPEIVEESPVAAEASPDRLQRPKSDVDALLKGLTMLIAKKRDLKQAAMQQLLTGQVRLAGFGKETGYKRTEVGLIPQDWTLEYIEHLAHITTGGKNTQDREDDGRYPFFVRSQTVERINSYSFDGEAVLTAGDGVGTGKVFHYINGKWYVYFAAGHSDDQWRIRMYVLENASANPLQGGWTERGKITTNWDSFALDATTFVHNGQRYLVWAQSDPSINANTSIYIARMGANPWPKTNATFPCRC